MKFLHFLAPKPTISDQDLSRGLRWLALEGGFSMGFFSITTSGFLAAFALIALLSARKGLSWYLFSFLIADILILISGSLWLTFTLKVSFGRALTLGALPFLYGDTLKVILAALIARLARQ